MLSGRPGFKENAEAVIPGGGNLDLCLTCGTCAGGCPAAGIDGMDPRKFLRMVLLGLDEEVVTTPWVWMCTQCQRCIYACPMNIDIPRLVYEARATWPREERPKGILGSCDFHVDRGGAMGIPRMTGYSSSRTSWKKSATISPVGRTFKPP